MFVLLPPALDLFGSAATGAFDPARSDVDLLVEFAPEARADAFDGYFGLKFALEALFARSVDLISVPVEKLANPYLRDSIQRSRRRLFAPA